MTRARTRRRWLRGLAYALGGVTLATGVTCGAWAALRDRVGEPSAKLDEPWHLGDRVTARDGRLLREIPSAEGFRGRAEADEATIGPRLLQATLTSEDSEFFEHDGVDRRAILRAALQNVRHQRLVSGASTITQQLVKLLDGRAQPHHRGVKEKLTESARAQNLEQVLGKPEILVAYINRLPYGHGLMGPEAAARGYFGVAPHQLSWAQASALAVLPRAPSYLDPYRHLDRVLLRQQALLRALHEEGHLDAAELERALAEPIELEPLSHPFHAPHMVQSLLASGAIERGEQTRTTLDLDLQRDVEGLVRTHVAEFAPKGVTDAAVVVVDNDTGEVLTYVGSADFHDPAIAGQVDMVRALRQPGSTLKPFVYAMAWERGHTAAEMVPDIPTRFVEGHGTTYTPVNYSRTFLGPISAREALAGSLNVPAVRLAAELEAGELLATLRDELGFTSLDREAAHYGLALSLGSGEVRLLELAAAYATVARGGEYLPVTMVLDDDHGREPPAPRRVLPEVVAAQVSEVLSDPLARIRGLHGRGPFTLPYAVAVKTGTSSGHRDTWAIGYTRERTVAVWVGNADGSVTIRLTGATGSGPLFTAVMRRAMEDVEGRRPLWEPGVLVAHEDICPLSGKRAGPACDERVSRLLPRPEEEPDASTPAEERAEENEVCDLHHHARRETERDVVTWRCDPEAKDRVVVFPPEFEEWLATHAPTGAGPDPFGTPWVPRTQTRECHEAAAVVPTLSIEEPLTGAVFNLGTRGSPEDQAIEVRAKFEGALEAGDRRRVGPGVKGVGEVEFLVDGRSVARSAWPYRAAIAVTPGDHEVLARPVDNSLSVRLVSGRFSVR